MGRKAEMIGSTRTNRSVTILGVNLLLLVILVIGCTREKNNEDSQLDTNKAIVMRAWEEAFNQGNLNVIDEVFDTSYIERTPYNVIEQGGPERVKQAFKWMHSVFGNLHFEVEQMVAEGDIVVSRAMATGTHIGEFMGVSATGQPVRFAAVVISRLSNGKHVEDWSFVDSYAILRQIGNVSVTPLESD